MGQSLSQVTSDPGLNYRAIFEAVSKACLGLWLAISKSIVEARGGGICGEKARESGALFGFRLPAPGKKP
jgi:K+-sensing histidine kinase KdpD